MAHLPDALRGPLVGLAVLAVALFTPGISGWVRAAIAAVGLAAAGIVLALASVRRWRRLAQELGLRPVNGDSAPNWASQPNLVGQIAGASVRVRTLERGSKTQRGTWIEYAVAAPQGASFQIWEHGLRARISGSLGLPAVSLEGVSDLVLHGDADELARLLGDRTVLEGLRPLGTLTRDAGWLHQRLPGNPSSAADVRRRLQALALLATHLGSTAEVPGVEPDSGYAGQEE